MTWGQLLAYSAEPEVRGTRGLPTSPTLAVRFSDISLREGKAALKWVLADHSWDFGAGPDLEMSGWVEFSELSDLWSRLAPGAWLIGANIDAGKVTWECLEVLRNDAEQAADVQATIDEHAALRVPVRAWDFQHRDVYEVRGTFIAREAYSGIFFLQVCQRTPSLLFLADRTSEIRSEAERPS